MCVIDRVDQQQSHVDRYLQSSSNGPTANGETSSSSIPHICPQQAAGCSWTHCFWRKISEPHCHRYPLQWNEAGTGSHDHFSSARCDAEGLGVAGSALSGELDSPPPPLEPATPEPMLKTGAPLERVPGAYL